MDEMPRSTKFLAALSEYMCPIRCCCENI